MRLGAVVVLVTLAGCANRARDVQAPASSRVAAAPTATKQPAPKKTPQTLGEVRAVELSHDAKLLAIGTLGSDAAYKTYGFIVLHDAQTGGLLRKWPIVGGVKDVALSHNGKLLAVASPTKVSLWQLPMGRLLHESKIDTGGGQFSATCDFSPDAKTLAVSNGEVWFYDVAQWTAKQKFTRRGMPGFVSSVTFSPDDRLLATTQYDVGEAITVRNLRTGKSMFSADGDGGGPIVFSSDSKLMAGRVAATRLDGTKIWNCSHGQLLRTLDAGKTYNSVVPQAFSLDGHILAGKNADNGRIELWNVRTGKKLRTLPQTKSVAFWADQRTLVTYDAQGVQRLRVKF